jgi:hypothetical protein
MKPPHFRKRPMLSLGAAARAFRANKKTLLKAVREGRLRATRVPDPRVPDGGRYAVDPSDLARFRTVHPWEPPACAKTEVPILPPGLPGEGQMGAVLFGE